MKLKLSSNQALKYGGMYEIKATSNGVFFGAPFCQVRTISREGAGAFTLSHDYGVWCGLELTNATVPEQRQPRQSRAA